MISYYVCRQESILSIEVVKDLKKSIEELPRDCFFFENRNGRWGLLKKQPPSHRYLNPNDSWFPVVFLENGKVLSEEITTSFCKYKNYETIKKTIGLALEWMSQQMSLSGQTKQMSMSIMQHYHLKKEETTSAISWHRDDSNHTLVISLDDEKKWSGGDFLFKNNENKLIRLIPKIGYGILFSNEGTLHSVESLQANEDNVDRTILTIHEK